MDALKDITINCAKALEYVELELKRELTKDERMAFKIGFGAGANFSIKRQKELSR